jgi:hypothetical protein
MVDAKNALPPLAELDAESQAQIRRLEHLLDEGLDDLDAGRTVTRDALRREIEALFAAHEAKKIAAP